MGRCKFCRKKCGVPMTCKHCSLDLCIGCYIPEVHMCKNLEEFIRSKKIEHIKELEKSKCVSVKMEKI